jgi:hypothetical protein
MTLGFSALLWLASSRAVPDRQAIVSVRVNLRHFRVLRAKMAEALSHFKGACEAAPLLEKICHGEA